MKINFIGYYDRDDGYGRFNSYLIAALQEQGVQVKPATEVHLTMPEWMQQQEGLNWNNLTISGLPPFLVRPVPGRHWVITMIEGTVAPSDWVERLNNSGAERILVPCQHNKIAYENSGVRIPISILPGGTDPKEFGVVKERCPRPYTFLTFADRGFRKGIEDVYDSFYIAFGGKTEGVKDVRLTIKSLPRKQKTLIDLIKDSEGVDERLQFITESVPDIRNVYAKSNCLVLPSRSEGWGMPHREAAMMGLPVIAQRYSGLDDGHLEEWALVVEGGTIKTIPKENKMQLGEWMVVDKVKLAEKMWWCYENYRKAREFALNAREWLCKHQTWNHSASILLGHLEKEISCVKF